MSNAARILARLRAEGCRVTLEDGKVVIEPSVGLTPAAIAELRLHKAELVRFLEDLAGVHRADEPPPLSRFTGEDLDRAASLDGLPLGAGSRLHMGNAADPPWAAPGDPRLVDLPGMAEAITAWADPTPARAEPKVKADRADEPPTMFGDLRRQSA